jgi:hypothetical protein
VRFHTNGTAFLQQLGAMPNAGEARILGAIPGPGDEVLLTWAPSDQPRG